MRGGMDKLCLSVCSEYPLAKSFASPTRPRQNGFVGLANGFIRAGNVILAGAGVPMFTTLNLFATANLPQARPVA